LSRRLTDDAAQDCHSEAKVVRAGAPGSAPARADRPDRNGEAGAVLLSVDDLEGLEMTLDILGDSEAVARISESLAALGRGEPGAELAAVRQDLARRRATGG
jgi:hypothetical protein